MNSSGRGSKSYPDPLQRLGILNPANWILPVTALSVISPLALLMVTALLASTEELWAAWRLRLPFFAPGIPAMAALLLSWLVAWRCSRRPGRLWPRLWALMLALASAALTPLALLYGSQSPPLAALSCGMLAGAIFLLPRLVRLHPDSSWMGRISVVMLLWLIVTLVALMATVNSMAASQAIDLGLDRLGGGHA